MQHSDYLGLMGVETWTLQVKESSEVQDLIDAHSYCLAGKVALIADANVDQQAQEQLCAKIVAALKVPLQGGFESQFDLVQKAASYPLVIFLGETLAKRYCAQALVKHKLQQYSSQTILITHSLSEMLATPQLKRQVWADLQLAMQEVDGS